MGTREDCYDRMDAREAEATVKAKRAARVKKNPVPVPLSEFSAAARETASRESCAVCKLPSGALDQIHARDRHVIPLATALVWLKNEYGLIITKAEWVRHISARHHKRRK
jgi:hypothetical protein